jgi:predicted NAD-dependent protein-ADP-ribosyltransferase YbiA (DUF1768 family)
MKVVLKNDVIVLIAETEDETADLARWKEAHADHALWARVADRQGGRGLELRDLGPRDDATREPINVVSNSRNPVVRIVSNLADTPFELDGRRYQSVESFWQGLKFPEETDRLRLAECDGPRARAEGSRQGYGRTLVYEGAEIAVGTFEHWQLMERACLAKFEQSADARDALLSTGDRPLVHIVRRDSKSIPGVIMAQIWMRLRHRLRNRLASARPE